MEFDMDSIDYEVVRKPQQFIIGLAVRTDNEKAMKNIPSKVITKKTKVK